MLLSSPSFSGFLDTLTTNGAAAPQQQQQAAPAPVQQAPVESRLPKDVSPYAAQQQMQNQHINMAILPDHNIDFSMLDLNVDGGYSYQPQVFSVMEVPEVAIDTSVLSGKTSNFVGSTFESDDEKIEMPVIERMPIKEIAPIEVAPVMDEEFDADPTFTLFSHSTSSTSTEAASELELTPIFGGIEPEKALARIELFDAAECEVREAIAIARVERLCSSLDDMAARLESMTLHL
jgi:bZIP-type transcription factor MBZ1